MSIRIVRGEVGSRDATTRILLPGSAHESLPPFERVAETIATPRRRFPVHRHQGVEVLTYVIEGSASYEFGPGPADPLVPGDVRLLTAPTPVSHVINPGTGSTVRWFAVVATLSGGKSDRARVQSGVARSAGLQPDGTIERRICGPGSGITAEAGLECTSIEFEANGTAFRRVGHDRVAVAYALSGTGTIDNQTLEAGEAALVEEAAGIALQGAPGCRVILVTAPRGTPHPASGR
ncbi:MAG TPA: pirin family protein [Thermoplasmata archaeon]|nr:pirin family protein [Thermoplasmata archaeon]